MRRLLISMMIIPILGLSVSNCGPSGANVNLRSSAAKSPHRFIDPWVLTCDDPHNPEPALLWNGSIGIRLGRTGAGLDGQARELPFFDIGHFERSGEEKILALPNPLNKLPTIDGNPINQPGEDYQQTLDMRSGELTSSWSIMSGNNRPTRIEHRVVLDPIDRLVAERWTTIPTDPTKGIIAGPRVSAGQKQTQSALNPHDWAATYEIGEQRWLDTPPNYDEILGRSRKTWAERWKTDIEIDGPTEDQQAIRSFLFYLRSAIGPHSAQSISPFGLSNATYNGHVFWDADIWVFPALAFVDPAEAAAIPAYRLAHLADAKQNFVNWTKSGRPTAGTPLGAMPDAPDGIMYPWESSVSGHETVPGESRFEHHITGSVAFMFGQAAALGLVSASEAQQIRKEADAFYLARSKPDRSKPESGLRVIQSVMSPDENHVGDDDLYTNLLAQYVHDDFKWVDSKPIYRLPQDQSSFLTYDADSLRGYKQAAAVLSIYPLQYPPAEKQAREMMSRFADKVTKNGPAMSDSVHSIISFRDGETEDGYRYWRESWQPFLNGPLALFSEKRNKPNAYFTTGAAGALQAVIYGILGFRLDSKPGSGSTWSTKLRGDKFLSIDVKLPKAWKGVKFTRFSVLGRQYDLAVTRSSRIQGSVEAKVVPAKEQ